MNEAKIATKKDEYVIVTRDGKFWTGIGWSAEYPNAEIYTTWKAAKAAALSLNGPIHDVIRQYGTDKEDVMESFPAKGLMR